MIEFFIFWYCIVCGVCTKHIVCTSKEDKFSYLVALYIVTFLYILAVTPLITILLDTNLVNRKIMELIEEEE